MKISNGADETTKIVDGLGSTETVEKHYWGGGQVSRPIRHHYKIKVKVKDQREEHEAYVKFSDDLRLDKTMLDPSFLIEHTKAGDDMGYYFIIKCFTKLEY